MKISYSLTRDNLYMYRVPMFQGINKLKLSKIMIEEQPQPIDTIDWINVKDNDYMRYVLKNYSKDIDVFYE